MRKGRLYVLSGPSGTGKGTICGELMNLGDPALSLSVSMTTRSPRNGEIPDVSYYFVTHEEFQKTIDENGFLEHAQIYSNCYGTPKAPVMKQLAEGKDVILEIEMQGAMQVKKSYPQARLIFVLPPSMAVLRSRLINRGTENEEQLKLRMKTSLDEIRRVKEYDYFVVNDDLKTATAQAYAIICAGRSEVDDPDEVIKKYEEEE